MLKILRFIFLIFSISIFFIGFIYTSFNLQLLAICLMFVHNIWYSCEHFKFRIVFFAFNVTFFTFLIARLVVKSITNYEDKYNSSAFGLDFSNEQVILNIFSVLFISLLFLFVGYSLVDKKNNKKNIKYVSFQNKVNINKLALVSLGLFYFTFIFKVLILLEKAQFTSSNGYMELYSSYSSSFPLFVVKLAEMCSPALFVYLGTLPTKRKSAIPIILYLTLGILSLVVGQRNDFVLNILLILIYLCLREVTDKEENWFGKKEIITTLCLFPILVVALNAITYIRMDNIIAQKSFFDSVSEFFYAQGVSVNLIGYAQTLNDQLPQNTVFSLGRITDFIRNNAVTQFLFDIPKYSSQTIESALYGNSFADSVSYKLSPTRYLNGWGYGSSYVAELYKDLGYLGVIIGNLLFGIILAIMPRLFSIGPISIWICLSMTRLLLYAPRDTTTSFIVSTFSLVNILSLLIIFLGTMLLSNQKFEGKEKY